MRRWCCRPSRGAGRASCRGCSSSNRTDWSSRPPASPRSRASLQGGDPAAAPRLRRRVARVAGAQPGREHRVRRRRPAPPPPRAAGHAHPLRRRFHALPGYGPGRSAPRKSTNAPHIALPRAAAGVSRRHCSLRREGERTVLIDHSRYGTWVNGARVRERAAGAPGRSRARRHAGRGVHAHFGGGIACASAP